MTKQTFNIKNYLREVNKQLQVIMETDEAELHHLHTLMFPIRINAARLADKVDDAFAKFIKEQDSSAPLKEDFDILSMAESGDEANKEQ